MSALLLKDYYVIFRQMKIFLLLILVFSCIPGTCPTRPWPMTSGASGTSWPP